MKTFIVDSFTNEPFRGNPAGVCFPEAALTDESMLNTARELGLSETAFVQPTDKPHTYTIRYFSPKKEIPLCGHATLASAKVLFQDAARDTLHFITVEKLDLLIRRTESRIIMEFPVYNTVPATIPDAMMAALGLKETIQVSFSEKNKILLVEIADAIQLAALSPDFAALLKTHDDINGVLVTSRANDNVHDYHYRYFWPWAGTNEDPVTGGVQTFLAKYWSDKLGKTRMRAFQCSARTGEMEVELVSGKVFVSGEAVIVLVGELLL